MLLETQRNTSQLLTCSLTVLGIIWKLKKTLWQMICCSLYMADLTLVSVKGEFFTLDRVCKCMVLDFSLCSLKAEGLLKSFFHFLILCPLKQTKKVYLWSDLNVSKKKERDKLVHNQLYGGLSLERNIGSTSASTDHKSVVLVFT